MTQAAAAPYSARMAEQPPQHHVGVAAIDLLPLSVTSFGVVTQVITPEEFRAGAIVLPEPWMVRHLMDHPEAMRDLGTWEFQVYMAALIERKWGRKVELGPRGADGGVDVRAERQGEFGLELMLVQCKHPRPGKPVDIDTVRLLHLQVIKQEATRGLVRSRPTGTGWRAPTATGSSSGWRRSELVPRGHNPSSQGRTSRWTD